MKLALGQVALKRASGKGESPDFSRGECQTAKFNFVFSILTRAYDESLLWYIAGENLKEVNLSLSGLL